MAERFYITERLTEHIGRTPEGFLLCRDVPINRTGEMLYNKREAGYMPWLNRYEADKDGNIRVLRGPEVVFDEETLQSFEGKPFTLDHPGELISPDNWTNFAELLKAGIRGVQAGSGTSPRPRIMIHIDRGGDKEFGQFLSISKGSCGEVKSHLYVALDQQYVNSTQFNRLYNSADEVGRLLAGFMAYLKQSDLRGSKFK